MSTVPAAPTGGGSGPSPTPRPVPGLNTSISVAAAGTSSACGMAQWDWAAITPGIRDRPPDVPPGPTIPCTSEATNAAGPRGHDRADGGDLLDLGRHVLHHHLARRQHDPLVVDGDGPCPSASRSSGRRRPASEVGFSKETCSRRFAAGGGTAGEVPLVRGRALTRRLRPAQYVADRLGHRHPTSRRHHRLGLPRPGRQERGWGAPPRRGEGRRQRHGPWHPCRTWR